MNVLITALMLLSAIQADAAMSQPQERTLLRAGGDEDGDGGATPGVGALDLNDATQTLADQKADASEKRQRILEDHLHEVEQKRYVVAAKLKGIDQIVQSDENRHSILKAKGLLTDDRNAKGYLHDADVVVQGKIELKIEKRARFAAEVIEQEHLMERNEALVVKKGEQTVVVNAKLAEQLKENTTLFELQEKEAELNRGVAQSQLSRLNDINEKLDLDKRGIDGLTGTLQTERAQETALTSQLAKIVHNGDEVTKIRADLSSETEQLGLKQAELESAKALAAQDKIDCAKNKVSFLAKGASSFLAKQKMRGEEELEKELADQEMHGQPEMHGPEVNNEPGVDHQKTTRDQIANIPL